MAVIVGCSLLRRSTAWAACVCCAAIMPTGLAQVVLNEVAADNRTSVSHAGEFPDWVELYNTGDQSVNLGGLSLSDDPTLPRKFVFPSNTVLAPKAFLVVWADDSPAPPGSLHSGFRLNAAGEAVSLYDRPESGSVLLSTVSFGLQLPDRTIGRVPDGSGDWVLTEPTPALPNEAETITSFASLKINEWLASNSSGADWLEIYNPAMAPVSLSGLILTDALVLPDNRAIPPLSFIDGQGFRQFFADDLESADADHLDFRLSASGETVTLLAPDRRAVIDRVTFGTQTEDISQGRLPDGSDSIRSFTTATPGASNFEPLASVVINEVLSHSDPPFEDAIELHNPTRSAVDIGHWWLSDSRSEPLKFQIPAGTILPPGGYSVFYESQFGSTGDLPFTLNSAEGDSVFLSTADASGALTGFRGEVTFGPSENGVSFGRYQTSTGVQFVPLLQPTFGVEQPSSVEQFRTGSGAPNAGPRVGPVVIHEIMYHPPDILEGTNALNNLTDEFVELLNITGDPVPLFDPAAPTNTWRLEDGVEFAFPTGFVLQSGSSVVVVGFDPQTDLDEKSRFLSVYGLAAEAVLAGPYRGNLSNSGERVRLVKPDTPQQPPHPNAGLVPYLWVDEIRFGDTAPWPAAPDGEGSSLQRRDPAAFGNDPVNWMAAAPTPGIPRVPVEAPQFLSIALQPDSLVLLTVQLPTMNLYGIEARDSLAGGSWNLLGTVRASSAGEAASFIDHSDSASSRFYRIRTF